MSEGSLALAWLLPLPLVLALACDTTARRPPEPGEDVRAPRAEPSALAPDPGTKEESGFAAELVPADGEPPTRPSGSSGVGHFAAEAHPGALEVLDRLRRAIAARSGKLHAVVIDLERGCTLAAHRATEPVNPASNMKLLTAAAALDLLGPAYGFRTEIFADVDASGLSTRLVLRGGGDPGLTSADLFRLAQSAAAQGLRKVLRLEVDQSLFDTPFVPPGFGAQPQEWASFRAPISALAVDGNTVTLNVMPTGEGQPARAWYDPPGVVQAQGGVETRAAGSGDRVAWTLDPTSDPQRPLSVLSGGLGAGSGRMRYTRRLEDPRRAPGLVLESFLSTLGVAVDSPVTVADAKAGASQPSRLTYVSSAPLAELLLPLGKDSDNFTAEMVLVALSGSQAGREKGPWSSARGAEALEAWLKGGGIPVEGVSLKNGSGLFDANRVTAETLALVLARMEARPEVFAEYLAQLSVYGTDGTLRHRMSKDENRSRVRAKTGTLSGVDALSGYVLRAAGLRPVVFSLVVTGATGGHAAVRQALDRAVFEWAEILAAKAPDGP